MRSRVECNIFKPCTYIIFMRMKMKIFKKREPEFYAFAISPLEKSHKLLLRNMSGSFPKQL